MSEGLILPEANLHGGPGQGSSSSAAAAPKMRFVESGIDQAIARAKDWLLSVQHQEGYWWAELEADTTLESDYILYLQILGQLDSPKTAKLAKYIRERQLADGGWNIFYGGPAELNATVKAYVALRLAGDAAGAPHLEKAKLKIHELGGVEATNSYVRFYLAMVGAVDWGMVPAIPPELMLLPDWFPINIWEMSSWTRGIVIPLALVYANRPEWRLPAGVSFDELFKKPGAKPASFHWDKRVVSWRNCFLALDRGLKAYEQLPWKPFRKHATERARKWMLERLERSEGLGTIYPAMMNSIFALLALGGDTNDPLVDREIRFLERYEIEDESGIRVQPCISPVWDTAIAMVSLEEAGMDPADPSLISAERWLLDNQVLGPGDWQAKNPNAEPGGWVFEFRNDFYPDVDDTAFVLMALGRVADPEPTRLKSVIGRGMAWLLSMQNSDGGWGAFDHENNLEFLNNIPFADHNAMLDPSTADVTARAVECLGQMGWPASHPVLDAARAFLRKDQTEDGSWFGRWGVNYVYGTSGVLRALETIGMASSTHCKKAANWLRSVQNPDGGFGETILSYYDASLKAKGKSTASQTAWGLIGLLAVAGPNDPAAERAVEWLVSRQNPDGSWDEEEFTGTGFPCVFYLKYHYYRNSFPLYALARYENMKKGRKKFAGVQIRPEEIEHRNGHWG
ncbi:MAG TPA: squalene--hopene cyclase [Candidatus Acidoferrales bacterium]|jgi:squalene-hopene/tetraprenyl-beta-curcumene cyclase|nr:squalene--hopene cyclase [Candidatus Acidoferrales bacterium]